MEGREKINLSGGHHSGFIIMHNSGTVFTNSPKPSPRGLASELACLSINTLTENHDEETSLYGRQDIWKELEERWSKWDQESHGLRYVLMGLSGIGQVDHPCGWEVADMRKAKHCWRLSSPDTFNTDIIYRFLFLSAEAQTNSWQKACRMLWKVSVWSLRAREDTDS